MMRFFYSWKTLLFVLGASLCCTSAFAQKDFDSLLKKFDRFRIALPQEKLYVHLSQELYLTGETVWFKIYYVDGALHRPMDISKVAYFEILDKDNNAVIQTKIAMKDGEGAGSVFLPASINSGNYIVRAYTQWMRNFSPEFFFHKEISIINSFRKLEAENSKPAKAIQAQFFPEGGNLVAGLKSKVAFQVTNAAGKGIEFNGIILNGENDTIAKINPLKFGIGNFVFTPQAGESYRAVITDTLKNSQAFSLPLPKSQGYVLEVRDSTPGLLAIKVSSNNPTTTSSPNFYYVIHARQIISSAGLHSFGNNKATIVIPKHQLQDGISHITIFDGNLLPQCERLYFKPSEKKLSFDIRTNQSEYGIRRKVTLDISAEKSDKAKSEASLSIAIVKSDSLQGDITGNIFNYLWLSSDLKGEVESPEYYDGDDKDVSAAIDNLMLTHGWRRFTWQEVIADKKKDNLLVPEYRGHLIRGIAIDQSGKPASGIPTFLSTPGRNIQLYTSFSKSNGEVQFEMKDFWGSRKIIVQPNLAKDSTVRIRVHSPFSDAFATRRLSFFSLQPNVSKNLVTRSVAMQVQDVYYGDASVKFKVNAIDSLALYGKASETYFLDDYTRFPVMEEVMREYVPGVMVRKRRDGFHFLVIDNVRKGLFQDNPLVLLDGMPIFDIDKIMAFDPLKVKKLEVLTYKYFLGPLSFPGVVSYTTYTGDLAGFQLDPRTISLDYEGLQRQQVFYTPQYENQKQRESRMPDRRHLLFWAPEVKLDADGKGQLEFYTSDLTGKYTIVVEGLSKDGYSGSQSSSFAVKQFNN